MQSKTVKYFVDILQVLPDGIHHKARQLVVFIEHQSDCQIALQPINVLLGRIHLISVTSVRIRYNLDSIINSW